jgi:hypothetical protein
VIDNPYDSRTAEYSGTEVFDAGIHASCTPVAGQWTKYIGLATFCRRSILKIIQIAYHTGNRGLVGARILGGNHMTMNIVLAGGAKAVPEFVSRKGLYQTR